MLQIQKINEELELNIKDKTTNLIENKILTLINKYFPNSVKQISSIYQFSYKNINLYFWWKYDNRWSFRNIFVNSTNNCILRWWSDFAIKVKTKLNNDEIINNSFLIFTQQYYPLFMICKDTLLDNFIKQVSIYPSLSFYNSQFDSLFYICLLEDFLIALGEE